MKTLATPQSAFFNADKFQLFQRSKIRIKHHLALVLPPSLFNNRFSHEHKLCVTTETVVFQVIRRLLSTLYLKGIRTKCAFKAVPCFCHSTNVWL